MSLEKLITTAAINYIKTMTYVANNNISVSEIGDSKIGPDNPVILVGHVNKKRIAGPLWQLDFVIKANVNNSHDPDKTTLEALYDVIEAAKVAFMKTASLLDTTGENYTIDRVIDIGIEQNKAPYDPMFSAEYTSFNVFVSYNDLA